MDRRKVLLMVAAVIAALGTLLVFLYVRGANNRAAQRYQAVQVLEAVKQITAGESVSAAQSAGQIKLTPVVSGDVLPGALTTLSSISNQVALTTIYPGEQIISAKFGSAAAAASTLQIPKGLLAMSVNLTDPGRVAGFVNPGDEVAVFMNSGSSGGSGGSGKTFTRLLLPKVEVIGVGTTTMVSTTTTTSTGTQTTEQLPRTLITLAVNQKEAEQVMFASNNGDLALGLLNSSSKVAKGSPITNTNLFH